MQTLPWRDKLQLSLCWLLIRWGKLRFDEFTRQELNALIAPHFPRQFPVSIPSGKGSVRLTQWELQFDEKRQRLGAQIFAELSIDVLGSTAYRAHLVIALSATPVYSKETTTIALKTPLVDDIQLVNDDFSLINDGRILVKKLLPSASLGTALTGVLTGPLRGVANLVSGGVSDRVLNYLQLYVDGSKQKILEHHKPDIEEQIYAQLDALDLEYTLTDRTWREAVFRRWGATVRVEENTLRFWF